MFSLFSRKKPLIYVARKNAMGDVLWMEPLIRHLASVNRVIVITPYYRLFDNYPFRNVKFKDYPDKKYKKLIAAIKANQTKHTSLLDLNMAYEMQPKMHILEAYFKAAGYNNFTLSYPRLYLSKQEKISPNEKPYALLHIDPGSISLNYRNAHNINWHVVTDHLKQKGFEPVFISNNNIGEQYNAKTITPSIRELISWVNSCEIFIGLDSGPSHFAAALHKPSVIFFGSVNPWFRHLKNEFTGIIMQKHCMHAGCYHEVHDTNGPVCRIVGSENIPPCCNFSTTETLQAIDAL